ncbi:MAG: hypothetical protein JNK24_05560 [Alphaproteobacteria bacterium]|nr:hypothetical protein [Alphaproteobacteria bacterium]
MGSLTARPKAPKPQVIYYTPTPTATSGTVTTTAQAQAEAASEENRAATIARRNRGLMGTVLTTLNGFLSDSATSAPARKTLLGE